MFIGTTELSRRTGATFRQINHWRYMGIIEAEIQTPGSGALVKFDTEIIPKVRFLVNVSNALNGLTLSVLAAYYEEGMIDLGNDLTLNWRKNGL